MKNSRTPEGFTSVLALWPSMQVLADDLGKPYYTVVAWRQRNRIPASEWLDVVESARKNGIEGITCDRFAAIARFCSA